MSQCCEKNGVNRFVRSRVATNLQVVKSIVSAKHDKANHDKTKLPVNSSQYTELN